MRRANRKVVSFTLDRDVLRFIRHTKGGGSASERLNRIVKKAMLMEMEHELEREAALFFAGETAEERRENRAFQRAGRRALARSERGR